MSGVGDYAATANQNPFFLKADNLRGKRGLRGGGRSPSPTAVPPAPPGRHSLGSCCHLPTDRPRDRPAPPGAPCCPPRGGPVAFLRGDLGLRRVAVRVCPVPHSPSSRWPPALGTPGEGSDWPEKCWGDLPGDSFVSYFTHLFIYQKKKKREIC